MTSKLIVRMSAVLLLVGSVAAQGPITGASHGDAHPGRHAPHRDEGHDSERIDSASRWQDRSHRRQPPGARRRRDRRGEGQVRDAGHHRRARPHRGGFDQRRRHDGQLDDRHPGRAEPDRHQHLPRSRWRRDVGQRPARQRQSDRRHQCRDQAALGQDRRSRSCSLPARRRASSSRSARTRRICARASAPVRCATR